MLAAQSSALAATDCPTPNQNGILSELQNEVLKTTTFVTRSIEDGFKSLEQLSTYLLTALTQAEQKNYLKYRDTIEVSAKAFQIPSQYLMCQLNSESRFSPTARSSAGAVGICQFESSSIQGMNEIISGRDRSTKIPGSPAAIVRDLWDNFPWSSIKTKPKRTYTSSDRTNAEQILPLCAMFAKQNAVALFGEAGEADWSPEKIEILVASYNLGLGGLQSVCGKGSITDPQSCINKLNPANHARSAAAHRKALPQVWAEMNQVGNCVKAEPTSVADNSTPDTKASGSNPHR
jgi:hypothetical protein